MIVLMFWAQQIPRLQAWRVVLDPMMHTAMVTLTFQLVLEAIMVGRQALKKVARLITRVINRVTSWLSRHVQFRFGVSVQLGGANHGWSWGSWALVT